MKNKKETPRSFPDRDAVSIEECLQRLIEVAKDYNVASSTEAVAKLLGSMFHTLSDTSEELEELLHSFSEVSRTFFKEAKKNEK
jgi:hypothetical protein